MNCLSLWSLGRWLRWGWLWLSPRWAAEMRADGCVLNWVPSLQRTQSSGFPLALLSALALLKLCHLV